MGTLSENWITERLMDVEYKKYVLLDYLQKVEENFREHKLYPDLSELIGHYKNLMALKNNTTALENNFRKSIKSVDLKKLEFAYDTISDETLADLKQIIGFSEPLMADELHKGKQLFDQAEQHIRVDHIGILPIYKREGFFLLCPFQSQRAIAYNYSFTRVNLLKQEVWGLSSAYYSTFTTSLSKPVDKIKEEIIYNNPQFPNPPVYLFKATAHLPDTETFLPVARRLLYKNLLINSD